MDRKNFFYRQLVTEAELDAAFVDVENGLKNLVADNGLFGIIGGFTPSLPNTSPYQVTLSSGIAYSKTLGRRLNYAGGVVALSTDEGSNPVTLPVTNGSVRIVSIFLNPTYVESDPRTDGYGNPVNFVKTESCEIRVAASAFGTISSLPTPPALRSDQLLVADVVTYRDSGVNYIFVVTANAVITTSVSPAGTFTINPRAEYLSPNLPADYLGASTALGGTLRNSVAVLAAKLKQYQTYNTLTTQNTGNINDAADVSAPASHNAFTSGGTFANKPGFYLLKKIVGVSTYQPTADVVVSPDQQISGGSPGSVNHVLDLNANNVKLNLVTNGEYSLRNLTIKGPTSSYKISNSVGPNSLELDHISLNPITTGNKLFFNVHNATASKFRKNYALNLKHIDSGLSNLVFGARKDVAGLPVTNVEDLISGNLTIDGQGGYYRNIRLEGTDTTIPVLNITGDNNIIENVVIASPAGNAPMLYISGNNNIIRNVYLHNFGSHSTPIAGARTNFQGVVFTAAATNNKIEALYIQGGSNAFVGSDTDLADGAEWTPALASVTDLVIDQANQPLADTVAFTASITSKLTSTNIAPTGVCVVEVWAKVSSGTEVFKLQANTGSTPANFTATTEWKKFRNVITGAGSNTVITNGDATTRQITFANPARYTLTNLGAVNLVVLDGTNNQVDGLLIENLQNNNSPVILSNSVSNKLSNVVFDGLYNAGSALVSGSVNLDNFKVVNLTESTPQFIVVGSGSCRFRDIDIDIAKVDYRNINVRSTLLYLTGTASDTITLENVNLIDNPHLAPLASTLYLSSCNAKLTLNNVYVESQYCNNPDIGLAALYADDVSNIYVSNSEFYAANGGAAALSNVFGNFINCTFRGGDSNPGAGIKLFVRTTSSYTNHLNLQNITMIYGDSNRNSTTSTDTIRMHTDSLIVEGLKIYSNTVGSSLSNLLKLEHNSPATIGTLKNVDFSYNGSVTNSALQAIDLAGRNLTLENVSISGWKIGNTDIATSLVSVANTIVRGLIIDGSSSPGTGQIDTIITQLNSSIYNIKLFPTQAIPTKVTVVDMVDDALVDANINRLEDLYLKYDLTTDPLQNLIRMNKGSQQLNNATILTEALCLDTANANSAVVLMNIGNIANTKYIPSTVSKVKIIYNTPLVSAIPSPETNPNNQPWQLKVISNGVSQRHIITDNSFLFSCPTDSYIVNVTNSNIFSNNILRNIAANAVALLYYPKTIYLTEALTSPDYYYDSNKFSIPTANASIAFPIELDAGDTIKKVTALVKQHSTDPMALFVSKLTPQIDAANLTTNIGAPDLFSSTAGYQGKTITITNPIGVMNCVNNFSNQDTVIIGTKKYKFQSSLTDVDGYVLLGATPPDSVANLVAAINLSSGAGTLYAASTTANGFVSALGSFDNRFLVVTALVEGSAVSIITAQTGNNHWESPRLVDSVVGSNVITNATGTLTTTGNFSNNETVTIGGKVYTFKTSSPSLDGEVLRGASATISLDNLVAAINLGAGAGTLYAAATTANTSVTAKRTSTTTMIATALALGAPGNSVTTTETCANALWSDSFLDGGTATASSSYAVTIVASNSAAPTPSTDDVIWVEVTYNSIGTNLLNT
jgi:hypothetical protein